MIKQCFAAHILVDWLSTILKNIFEPESVVTMLIADVIDNIEQCGQQNFV